MNINSYQHVSISVCFIGVLLSSAHFVYAQKPTILDETTSPSKHTAIFQYGDGYEFVDLRSHKGLGQIHAADDRSNIRFVTSWNADDSKVAVLMYYGTRLNCLLIYQRNAQNTFVSLPFHEPQPMELYKKVHGDLPFAYDGSTYSADAIGPWSKNDTVRLIAGESHLDGPNLFVTFDSQVTKSGVVIHNIKMHELIADDQANHFLTSLKARH